MGLLRDRLDSVAPDLPGFGWSAPPAGDDYSLGAHARAIVELAERPRTGPPARQLARRDGGHGGGGDTSRPGPHPHPRLAGAAGPAPAGQQRAPARAGRAVGRAAAGPAARPVPRRAAGPRHPRALLGRPVAGPGRAAGGGDGRGRAAGAPRARRRRDDPVAAQPDGRLPAAGPVAAVAARRPGRTRRPCWSTGSRTGSSTRGPPPGRPAASRTTGCCCCRTAVTSRRWSTRRRSAAVRRLLDETRPLRLTREADVTAG